MCRGSEETKEVTRNQKTSENDAEQMSSALKRDNAEVQERQRGERKERRNRTADE